MIKKHKLEEYLFKGQSKDRTVRGQILSGHPQGRTVSGQNFSGHS